MQAAFNLFHVVSVKSYPWFLDWFSFAGTFYIYAASSAFMGVWGVLTIRMNEGLTLAEVEKLYES